MTNYINNYKTEDFNNITGNEFTYTINNNSNSNNNSNEANANDDFAIDKYLHKIFIKLTLPDIYSSKSRQFKWIKYLGYNIIKDVKCEIKFKKKSQNNVVIIKTLYTYTEWLYIWNEINLSAEEKNIHYELIGHIPELYDPSNSNNISNTYPSSHLNRETYKWIISDTNTKQANFVNITNDYNYNKPPSIPSKTLYIPLNFYFCNDIKNMLPLNIIDNIKIIVSFRPVEELYTVLLQPEDFILDSNNQNISNSNFGVDVKLPNTINFVNNKIPNFTSNAHLESNANINNLSMFDVLINKYEIKPLSTGNTAINNFLIDPSSDPKNNSITNRSISVNSIITFYQNICKTNITYNIVKYKAFEKNILKCSGLLSPVDLVNVLNTNTNEDGSVKQFKFILSKTTTNRVKEIFFVLRHAEREKKNDLLNFTNLDYNNKLEWDTSSKKNNTVSYSSSIELLSNSIWEHEANNTSIKLGIDNLGVFYIKKHIVENNIFKYVDILNYKAEEENLNRNSIYNSNSNKILNEKILDKFKLIVKDNNDTQYEITNNSEPYDFYNKLCIYKKYKKTLDGLYYINNIYPNGIKNIELSLCDFNKITINSSDEYKSIIFCIEEVNIDLN